MLLKLPFTIKDHPVFPKNRPFTELEALIDFLISGRTADADTLSARWMWEMDRTMEFIYANNHWFKEDIYLKEESAAERRAIAQEVIDLYNRVFERKISLDNNRLKLIWGRIKDGKRQNPPIGLAQFKAVFEHKKEEWSGTEQDKYLTIATMCAPSHFMEYLDAARLAYKKNKEKKPESEGIVLSGSLFKTNGGR